jgi:branched-chain amino acid transport system permease protein
VVAYGSSGYRDAIAFIAIIFILLIKPQGLFGQAHVEARR